MNVEELGEQLILGKLVNLDEEDLEKLNQIEKSLKQIEINIKENLISKI